jgi:hypothetical protein
MRKWAEPSPRYGGGHFLKTAELVERIEASGGVVTLRGGRIHCVAPESCASLLDDLRTHKDEVLKLLHGRAEHVVDGAPSESHDADRLRKGHDREVVAPVQRQSADIRTTDSILPDDAYSLRLRAALREVCKRDYPAGMPIWLRQRNHRLYAELIERLPDDLNRIWSARGPLDDFERVLARWSETHSTACALYRAEKRDESDR